MNRLTKCKFCGNEIARGADKCPSCGGDQKNFFQKHKIFTFILAIILVIAGLSMINNDKNNETAQKKQATEQVSTNSQEDSSNATNQSVEKKWVEVTKITGDGIKNTENFTVDSDNWRISWDTQAGDAGEQNFQIYVNDGKGNLVDVAANVIGANTDTTYMHKAGEYSLKIITAQPYTITIEEAK